MKVLVKIVLLLFITFLAAPTIISLVKSDADTSVVYSLTEEEVQKEIKEIPATLDGIFQTPVFSATKLTTVKIPVANLQKHNNVAEEIFLPPPELL